MANLNFQVSVQIKNGETLPEISARARDFRPAFDRIVVEWAKLNKQKFSAARGAESSGVAIDDVHWMALKPATSKRKRDLGQPDAIMHATGALEDAMTDPSGFFSESTAQQVAFGRPHDDADAAKVQYNWNARQVIFLGMADINMIRENIVDYLSLGSDYRSIKNAKGMDALRAGQMDMEFQDQFPTVNDTEDLP